MSDFDWKDADHDVHYYFKEETGRIIGQATKITHTKVWVAKVFNNLEELYLGQYITCDFAKKSIQEYWDIHSRTLIE